MTNSEKVHRRGCEKCEYQEVIIITRADHNGEPVEYESPCECTLENSEE